VFGGAKFIHLVRKPSAFVSSAIARGYYQSPRSDRGHILPKKDPVRSKWRSMSLDEKALWNWIETNRYIDQFKKDIDRKKIVTLLSKDLFSNSSKTIRILSSIGVEKLKDRKVAKYQNKPVNTSDSGDQVNINNEEMYSEAMQMFRRYISE